MQTGTVKVSCIVVVVTPARVESLSFVLNCEFREMRENKRLFVGNLPPNVSENDLIKEFSSYGKVVAVDLKSKEGKNFGFLNIEIDDYMTRQCIQEFKEAAFKGCFLTVSVAKESFLDKLKREREESTGQSEREKEAATRPKVQEVESEEFVIKPSKFKAEPVHNNFEDDQDGAFKRRSKGAYFENGKVKILGGTGTRLHAGQEDSQADKPTGVAAESNQKRLESLQKLKQAHDQQKFAIRNALKNSDSRKNNKIVFDSEDAGPGRSQLFDNDDEEGDFSNDFRSKKQFEGAQGQKLLELKTKFRNDDRFQMDEDFHEGGDEGEAEMTEQQGERQRQLEILGSVVGKSFESRKKKGTLPATMLRFDPSKATHQKFYKQTEEATADDGAFAATEDVDMPQVSSDQFYKVSNGIGDAMKGQSQGFSLLKMMGHDNDEVGSRADGGNEYYAEPIEKRQRKSNNYNENPFKYESSDDEAKGRKKSVEGQQKSQQNAPKAAKIGGKANKRGIFRENFFILDGDARLDQGLAFFSAGPRDKTRNFHEIKKKLKLVVNQKIRKNKSMQKANSGRKVFKPRK